MMASFAMDLEYTLTFGNQIAVVSSFGASLRRYVVNTPKGEWNVLWGYSGTSNKKGGQGDVLIPFPGRIKNGSYEFEGVRHQLSKNDKDGPNAIHGFLRSELFNVKSVSAASITFDSTIDRVEYAKRGFPYSLIVEIKYELSALGLKTEFKIRNVGSSAAPIGVGFHPYFRADVGELKDWEVQIPARSYVELENLIPTGKVPAVDGTKYDFTRGRLIGNDQFNACLAHLVRNDDGLAHATLKAKSSNNRVLITLDPSFDYIVIYTGDAIPAPHQRQGFAIEPMTCAPDAFNHEGWGTRTLEAGAEFHGTYTVIGEWNES